MSHLNRYETTPRSGISTARYVLHFLAPKLRQRELLRLPDVKDLDLPAVFKRDVVEPASRRSRTSRLRTTDYIVVLRCGERGGVEMERERRTRPLESSSDNSRRPRPPPSLLHSRRPVYHGLGRTSLRITSLRCTGDQV